MYEVNVSELLLRVNKFGLPPSASCLVRRSQCMSYLLCIEFGLPVDQSYEGDVSEFYVSTSLVCQLTSHTKAMYPSSTYQQVWSAS